jgi:glycosyltransferase involved in cell wall biosynthesis
MARVIYAWDYIEWGGAQIHFLALIKEARKAFEVVVLLPKGTDQQFLGFLATEGIRYELFRGNVDLQPRSGVIEKIRRHWVRIKGEYAMLRAIEAIGTEEAIVHTDILPGQSLLSLIWICLRAPVFITLHNALPPVSKWRWTLWKLKFRIISKFDTFHVFCTNQDAAKYFSRLFSKRVADDIKITYDSINPVEICEAREAPFDRNQTLNRLNIQTDKFLVLAVGQFVDRKGRWIFLEAAKMVKAKTDDIVFVWLSPMSATAADTDRVESLGLGDSFHLVKSENIGKKRQDILKFFRIADLFVLPSYIEGVPIALLEAMAIGLPCVSTNVYGIPEAVINEETGLLIKSGDARELSESILRLAQDRQLRSRLSEQGRQLAITKFDERIAARTAVAAYKTALEKE